MSPTPTRKAARAGVTGAAVGALGLLALQGLQQASGAFELRAEVSAAIVGVVVFATLFVERLRVRSNESTEKARQEEALRQAARNWEPPLFDEVKPNQFGNFGVFPVARSVESDFGDYVEREVDRRLREALATVPFVLVYGGPRAGKSRTALQAAKVALGDARVVVPRDADGLRVLLDWVPDPTCKRVVLWLDGLERYAEVIDGETLDRLRATHQPSRRDDASLYSGPPVTVVATIREATWDELLNADGQLGEFAKAVAARARAFKVPTKPHTTTEERTARRLYPGVNLGSGIGPGLASSGKEEKPPVSTPVVTDDGERTAVGEPVDTSKTQRRLGRLGGFELQLHAWSRRFRDGLLEVRRDKLLLAPALLCMAAVLAIPLFAFVFKTSRMLTVDEQQAELQSSGAAGTRKAITPERADFHGSGKESRVLAFQDEDRTQTNASRADEIRVYDVVGDQLELRFRFEPDDPAVYQFRGVEDIDGDGREELLGGYGPTTWLGNLLVPFALDWDEDAGEYQMVGLHQSKPRLEAVEDGRSARRLGAPYRQLARYRDSSEGTVLSGYPTQDFALPEGSLRLLSGYYVSDSAGKSPQAIELQAEVFDTQGSGPRLRACRFSEGPPVLNRDQNLLLFQQLERWARANQGKSCEIQY